jgi:hypothetical protein
MPVTQCNIADEQRPQEGMKSNSRKIATICIAGKVSELKT